MINNFNSLEDQIANDPILEPYRYLTNTPGKDVRSSLISSFNLWLNVDSFHLKKIKQIIGMLHNASLLIDDIEDNSKLRRGIPVAHAIFGIPTTINTGNYVYFLAMQSCNDLGSHEALSIFLEEILSLHRGQGFDIHYRDNAACPSEDDYLAMASAKTGGLFRLAVRLMQAFSSNKTNYVPLVNDLGLFFQIRDDYMNIQSEKYHQHKSFCEDITEGKFSFPIIHGILSDPKDHTLANILKQKTESVELKKYAAEYRRKVG
eukprot:TRINITY_DN3994_c0_g1_i2.p1 TRINITY_DN3994_c0_g1~~TRINITY_DN3994_c0_g1_i2.p1  ORF type:complete len:261 (+),score=44.48 TRINITY_DN3994_c0_g1_i2:61-843(+)